MITVKHMMREQNWSCLHACTCRSSSWARGSILTAVTKGSEIGQRICYLLMHKYLERTAYSCKNWLTQPSLFLVGRGMELLPRYYGILHKLIISIWMRNGFITPQCIGTHDVQHHTALSSSSNQIKKGIMSVIRYNNDFCLIVVYISCIYCCVHGNSGIWRPALICCSSVLFPES